VGAPQRLCGVTGRRSHQVWREALQLYRDHGRDKDAERVQHQLDQLDVREYGNQQA
jgi:hypothetical protein